MFVYGYINYDLLLKQIFKSDSFLKILKKYIYKKRTFYNISFYLNLYYKNDIRYKNMC